MSKLTHLDEHGAARMVDVAHKDPTRRAAIARGRIDISPAALDAARDGAGPKGDVLATARLAGIMAAKRTWELVPLCHQVALSSVQVYLELVEAPPGVEISAEAHAVGRTGVEMEALTAVSVAALTVYDMLKAVDRRMRIRDVCLVEKTGGSRGDFKREGMTRGRAAVQVVPKRPGTPGAESPDDAAEVLRLTPKTEPPEGPVVRAVATRHVPSRKPSAKARRLQGRVRELHRADEPLLAEYLFRDRIQSAYLLGNLEEPYRDHSRWFGLPSKDGGELKGVLLLYTGLSMPAVLTAGGEVEVEALLGAAWRQLPRRFYGQVRSNHRRGLDLYCRTTAFKLMNRMGLRRERFVGGADTRDVVTLSHRDTAAIMRLYGHYPDNFFEPAQLETGLYFGIRDDRELVSVAGIHVLSAKNDVACIGNIVTHTERRGEGLAARCIAKLLGALFERVRHVALNVGQENLSAIAVCEKFGFEAHHEFLEGWVDVR